MTNESVMTSQIEDTQVYEISFILDNKIDEASALTKLESLKELIASNSGSFISEEAPYMRELAYEMVRVQNNINVRFNEGYFGWIKFNLPADKISVLDKKLKLDEQVVRHLVLKAEVGNDIITKDKTVFRSSNELVVSSSTMSEVANIDATVETVAEPVAVEDVAVEMTSETKE